MTTIPTTKILPNDPSPAPTFLPQVRPGDIISSAFINGLLQRIAVLEGHFATNLLTVPNVVGRPFPVATQTMNAAGLRVGTVIDVAGQQVQATDAGAGKRLVVATTPAPGDSVTVNRDITFLLTVQAVEKQGPDISSLQPTQVTIGAPLTILGHNFTTGAQVLLDGVKIDNAVVFSPELIRIDPVPPFIRTTGGGSDNTQVNTELAASAERTLSSTLVKSVTVTVQTADGVDSIEAPFAGNAATRPFITDVKLDAERNSFVLLGGSFGGETTILPEVFLNEQRVTVARQSQTTITVTKLPQDVVDLLGKISNTGWKQLVDLDRAGKLQPTLLSSSRFGTKLTKVLIPPTAGGDTKTTDKNAESALKESIGKEPIARERIAKEPILPPLPPVGARSEVSIVVRIGTQLVGEPFLLLFATPAK